MQEQQQFWHSPSTRILGALVLLMALIAMGSYASLNFAKLTHVDETPSTISVSGEGEAVAVPDIGQFSFSVQTEADDAASAQADAEESVSAIVAYLQEQGIEDADIKTVGYNLYPRWRYEESICPAGSFCPPGERVQDGFEVNQTIEVKVRDTENAGTVIAGVGERGATNISSLRFTIDDPSRLQLEAREKAIADAREKAQTLANQLGVRLVRIAGFSEGGGQQFMPYDARTMNVEMAADESGMGGATLPTGEDTTTINVNITYEIE